MQEKRESNIELNQKKRLIIIFDRLLPLLDSLAGTLRSAVILGFILTLWFMVWFYHLKHFSMPVSLLAGSVAFIPALVLARFWWAVAELKHLPDITSQMLGDAKAGLQDSVQNLQAGKLPKIGFFSAGKNLWSAGAMALEAQEIAGSYFSLATLANPFMLALGAISLASVFLLFLLGIMLAFFI